MKLAVAIPTRGVIFAQTIQTSILNPELPVGSVPIIVSGLPIPNSHAECVRRFLATDCTHIWFVEEDMDIPPTGLSIMMAYANEGKRYVAIDYPITATHRTTIWEDKRQILWTGFGCTMIERSIFEKEFKDPWFTDEYEIMIECMRPFKYSLHHRPDRKNKYGAFDIYFGVQLLRSGIEKKVLDNIQCKHLRLRSWERKTDTNQGQHEIYEL